jgi:hypothetical protein
LRRLGNARAWFAALPLMAAAALAYSAFVAIHYASQPLVERHGFRQTQTALTSYWMIRDGWKLAYETPVGGFPWSIPFEFPIYQTVVAVIAGTFDLDLEVVGRLVSYAFLVGCAWPAFSLSRRLDLPAPVPWVFCALLWTSPLYVFWGRTFMIETAAIFFAFACLPYAVDLIRGRSGWIPVVPFLLLGTAAVLQKATTGGPVLLFLVVLCAVLAWRRRARPAARWRTVAVQLATLALPLLVGAAWTRYSDEVKMLNAFGPQLTSQALAAWNFGTLAQKLSLGTYESVVWHRSIVPNAGGALGVLLLLAPWSIRNQRPLAWLSAAAIALFLLPILIFTNLHAVHDYYQSGCVLFLLAALAVAVGGWLTRATRSAAPATVATLALMISNVAAFAAGYGGVVAGVPSERERRPLAIGRLIREQTVPGTGIVVFGADWSSEIAYYAQRKSLTAPEWFTEYREAWRDPQRFLGDLPLGAIVVCPTKGFPGPDDVRQRIERESNWRRMSVEPCDVLIARP